MFSTKLMAPVCWNVPRFSRLKIGVINGTYSFILRPPSRTISSVVYFAPNCARLHNPNILQAASSALLSSRSAMVTYARLTSTDLALAKAQLDQLNDSCIVVDTDDNVLGQDTKKNCHYLPANPKGLLHRAFSVFLFNSKNELLLQKRSMSKITFPGHFTNSCCSHPTYSADEIETENAIGIKRAAQRRLSIELGIDKSELPLDCFNYVTRIHYQSHSSGEWGEHEIDYVLFVKRDVTIRGNVEEVMSHCYVAQDEMAEFLDDLKKQNTPITPWFKLIVDNLLTNWWTNLDNIETLADHQTIHRYV